MQDINFLVEQKNGTIGMNFDEVKETLSNGLEEYRHMTFTEDSKTEAKKTVASLRKLKKTVNDKKNEVKKSFMVPYTDFETKVKELDKLIDEPINFINAQVETFERNRVEERKMMKLLRRMRLLLNICHYNVFMTASGKMPQLQRKRLKKLSRSISSM